MVYNIGIYEKGKYTSRKDIKAYKIWKGMIQRCYSEESLKRFPTYRGCRICDEWLHFQTFAEWFYKNYVEGWTLDKDILGNGKLYSTETCCFVPNRINNLLTRHWENEFGQGVKMQGNRFRVQVNTLNVKRKHIGYYRKADEAKSAYSEAKRKAIEEIVNYYPLKDKNKESIIEKI